MTTSPIADLNDTLLAWASSAEAELATKLKDVQLFVELDINGDELERLTRFYGTFLGRQITAGADDAALLQTCPALTAAVLISRAAKLNEVPQVAAEFWAGLGLEATENRVALIEGHFAEILQAAGLDPMDDLAGGPDGEMGRLFGHVGIASDWTPELIELIDTRRMSGEAAEDLSEEAAAVVAELATQRLQLGPLCATSPELAQKLIEPVVRVVHQGAEEGQWHRALQKNSVFPLVAEEIAAELRERPIGTVDRRYTVGVAHAEDRPRLRLDVLRRRVLLRLPEQELADSHFTNPDEVRWRLDFDGSPSAFITSKADRPGAKTSEIFDIPVRRPLREIWVRNVASREQWQVSMVSTDDPSLIFTERGGDLTEMATLHHAAVWVVCPSDARAVDPVSDQEIPVLEEHEVKAWEGWTIRLLDLSEALSLHIERPGERRPSIGSVRAVDPRQRVRFVEPGQPVPGLRTQSGRPILSEPLLVEFPPTQSGAVETWFLTIGAYAGPGEYGDTVADEEPLEVPPEGGSFEVFDPEAYDSPWAGEYLVRLRGPRNESFRHEYALVEGLSTEVEIDGPSALTRLPQAGGLSPTTVKLLAGDKPFSRRVKATVGPDQKYVTAVVETDAGDALPVVVHPPRLRYQLTLRGEEPMWRTEAVRTSSSWLDQDTKFRVRPGSPLDQPLERPSLVIRDRHGAPVRTLKLETEDNITWSAELAAAASSLAVLSQGSFELEFIDSVARRRVSVRLANIVPAPTWNVTYADGSLVFDTGADADAPDLGCWSAWVWPVTAPWQPARTVTIGATGEPVELPAELQDAGPLAVQLFAPDRFSFLRPPSGPGERAQTVEAEGYFGRGEDTPWSHLSAFLVGEAEQAPSDPEILPTLWDVQAGWLQKRAQVPPALSQRVREALTHDARASVHAMGRSLVATADRPAQFIASGLVHSSFDVTQEELMSPAEQKRDEIGTPWIHALDILGAIARLDEDDAEQLPSIKALKKQLAATAGEGAVKTLEMGHDRSLENSCIDATTVQIAHMNEDQQKAVLAMFFGDAGLVPGAISDENSRLIAVFDTFTHRVALSELLGDPTLMTTAVAVLRRIKSANRQLYLSARVRFERLDGVDTDDPQNRWALAPVISMVFALATRMHAHGHLPTLGKLPQAYEGWAKMAQLVPDLVTGDVVLADAMVLGVFGPNLKD